MEIDWGYLATTVVNFILALIAILTAKKAKAAAEAKK